MVLELGNARKIFPKNQTYMYVIKVHLSFFWVLRIIIYPFYKKLLIQSCKGYLHTYISWYEPNPNKHSDTSFFLCQTLCGVVYYESLPGGNDIFWTLFALFICPLKCHFKGVWLIDSHICAVIRYFCFWNLLYN